LRLWAHAPYPSHLPPTTTKTLPPIFQKPPYANISPTIIIPTSSPHPACPLSTISLIHTPNPINIHSSLHNRPNQVTQNTRLSCVLVKKNRFCYRYYRCLPIEQNNFSVKGRPGEILKTCKSLSGFNFSSRVSEPLFSECWCRVLQHERVIICQFVYIELILFFPHSPVFLITDVTR